MLAQALQSTSLRQGLRPFDPLRDLGAVADLIEQVFSERLPFTGAMVIDEMRRWARRTPMLLLMTSYGVLPSGFVWEERGEIVGNLSLSQLRRHSGDWLISNVAVHPAYRRRGIARQLMGAALEAIRAAGGENVVLQVRTDNSEAQRLYASLGFHRIYTTVELQCPADHRRAVPAPRGLGMRAFRMQDRRQVRNLIQHPIPYHLQRFTPLFVGGLHLIHDTGWSGWLDDLLAKRRTYRMVLEEGERITGFVAAQRHMNAAYYSQLFFAVHATRVGTQEAALVQQGLHWLNHCLAQPILTIVPASAKASLGALSDLGFAPIRRLDQMRLEIAS